MNLKSSFEKIADAKLLILGFLMGLSLIMFLGARPEDRGPYMGVTAGANDVFIFIVDTRDGHAWRLGRTDFFDFGTPDRPISERSSTNPILK